MNELSFMVAMLKSRKSNKTVVDASYPNVEVLQPQPVIIGVAKVSGDKIG